MFIFSVSSFSCSCIFFVSFIMCVFVIVWVSLSLLHSFVCFFFRCVCVLMVWLLCCCCWHWVLRLTFSFGHLFLTLALPSFYHLFPSVVSHHSSKLFQFDSFLCSFRFNSSSTALTISFIRFVLIDFYGFCYLLLFASLCFFCFSSQFLPY